MSPFPKDLLVIDSWGFAYINPAMFAEAIAQDINSTEANVMAVVQKPSSVLILAKIWPSCMEAASKTSYPSRHFPIVNKLVNLVRAL